jgi:hypothetical protein
MSGNTFRPFDRHEIALVADHEGAHEATCFADEVAVDFPSVAPAIDRIRRGLQADERPRPLVASIHLTAREAFEGATVPLEVPVRCTCRHCGGRGELWAEACARCQGSGTEVLRHLLEVTIPAGVLDGTRFRFAITPRHHPPTHIELHVLVAFPR